jgi:hypothetical protein
MGWRRTSTPDLYTSRRDGIERLRVSGDRYHESKALADAIEQQLRK